MPSNAQKNQKALALPFSLREQLYLTWLPAGYMPVMHWVHRLVMNEKALYKLEPNKILKLYDQYPHSDTIRFLIHAIKFCLDTQEIQDENPASDELLTEVYSAHQLTRDLNKLQFDTYQHKHENARETAPNDLSNLAINIMQTHPVHLILFSGLYLYHEDQARNTTFKGLSDYTQQSATGLLLYYISNHTHASRTISNYATFMALHRALSSHINSGLHDLFTRYDKQAINKANTFLSAYFHHQLAHATCHHIETKKTTHPLCPAIKKLINNSTRDIYTLTENDIIHSILGNGALHYPKHSVANEEDYINIIICLMTLSNYCEMVEKCSGVAYSNQSILKYANIKIAQFEEALYFKKGASQVIVTLLTIAYHAYIPDIGWIDVALGVITFLCVLDCVNLYFKPHSTEVSNMKALTTFLANHNPKGQTLGHRFTQFYTEEVKTTLPTICFNKNKSAITPNFTKIVSQDPTGPRYENPHAYNTWTGALIKKVRSRLPKRRYTQETYHQSSQTKPIEKYSFTWTDEHGNKYRYDHPVDHLQNNHAETTIAYPIAQDNLPRNMHPTCYAAVSPTLKQGDEHAAELALSAITNGVSFVGDRNEQGIKWTNGIPVLKFLGANGDTRFPLTNRIASEQEQQLMPKRAPQYATLFLVDKAPMDHQELQRYVQEANRAL